MSRTLEFGVTNVLGSSPYSAKSSRPVTARLSIPELADLDALCESLELDHSSTIRKALSNLRAARRALDEGDPDAASFLLGAIDVGGDDLEKLAKILKILGLDENADKVDATSALEALFSSSAPEPNADPTAPNADTMAANRRLADSFLGNRPKPAPAAPKLSDYELAECRKRNIKPEVFADRKRNAVRTAGSEVAPPTPPARTATLSDYERSECARRGISEQDFAKRKATALRRR